MEKTFQTNIKRDEVSNTQTSYVDATIEIDLGEHRPKLRKMPCIPVDVRCFLPMEWDALDSNDKKEVSFQYLLNIEDGVSLTNQEKQGRRDYQKNNYVIGGNEDIPNYLDAIKPILRVIDEVIDNPEKPKKLADDAPINIHPLKLLYYVLAIDSTKCHPVDRDILDLIFDKIALSVMIPLLMSKEHWLTKEQKTILSDAEKTSDPVAALDAILLRTLDDSKFLLFPTHSSLMTQEELIELPSEYWQDLFKYALCPDEGQHYVTFAMDEIDDILTLHLDKVFKKLITINTATKVFWNQFREKGRLNYPERRFDFGYFYNIADKFFDNDKRPLSFGKLPYIGVDADLSLPFIEYIDMKPLFWEAEAIRLTTEMRIISKSYNRAWSVINVKEKTTQQEIEEAEEEMRTNTAKWSNIKSSFDLLASDVALQGYQLTYKADDKFKFNLGDVYKITKKKAVSYKTQLKKEKTVKRKVIDNVPYKKCKAIFKGGAFGIKISIGKRCFTAYTKRERWVDDRITWYETITKQKLINVDVDLGRFPIDEYLDSDISVDAVSSLGAAQKLKYGNEDVTLSETKDSYIGRKNRDKTVYKFSLVNGQYYDENGREILTLLKEIDDDADLLSRALFLIPKLLSMPDGESLVVGYYAVHMPSLGRGSLIEPRIYLQETFSVTVGRAPGHWIGKFSHCESMFPGEKRSFKLKTERNEEMARSSESTSRDQINDSAKRELEDKINNSFVSENGKTTTTNWNAKASGGANFGVWKAGGSAGGSGQTTSSSKDVKTKITENVEKVVTQHSHEKEVKFKANYSEKSTINTSKEEVRAFENINQGRSVNYKFFQIMHKYFMESQLRKIKVIVEYNDELIPGLKISNTDVFDLSDISQIFPELIEEERSVIQSKILEFAKTRFKSEKVDFSDGESDEMVYLNFNDKNKYLGVALDNILDKQSWYVNSGAFFVETEVSFHPATEDYIEEARDSEIDIQKAKSIRISAEAEAIKNGGLVLPSEGGNFTIYLTNDDCDKSSMPKGE